MSDLPAALELQALGYPAHLRDGEAAFVSRLRVAPGWCWVAHTRSLLEGYLLSHPWASMSPPAPDVVLHAAEGPIWYVHDVSVGALVRGQGVARAMLDACFAANPGIRRSELIAVEHAGGFWERQGWRPLPEPSAALAAKVAGYGDHASYMVRQFD